MPITIQDVTPGSAAQAAGLRGGMQLYTINWHPILDGLDYEFYSAAPRLSIRAGMPGQAGRPQEFTVEKGEYEPLGCEFESYLADAQRRCKNKCIFCFIDQLPKGLRPSLYFKDDDERLGFLFGNYITLTNLTMWEVQRIIDMRFSPVNISVHTANPALREQMMGNPHAGDALWFIPRLAEGGVEMNFQLVLCPGLNDGPELVRSIQWLASFRPYVRSIAAVPVGLTRHRRRRPPLHPYTKEQAAAQLDILLKAGNAFEKEDGNRLVYPSDEWFLLAGRKIPPEAFYGGYPQLENGVGMWRSFYDEFAQALKDAPGGAPVHADVAAGVLAAPLLRRLGRLLAEKRPASRLHVHAVQNDFLGHSITVSGLLCGCDIMAQLAGKLRTRCLLLPPEVLRAEGDVLLDDVSPAQIGEALGVRVLVPPSGGKGFLQALLRAE